MKRSYTVSIGESVTLSVETDVSELRWRHNGEEPTMRANGEFFSGTSLTLSDVGTEDGGIYECHENHKRAKGQQAIFQLVVRGT